MNKKIVTVVFLVLIACLAIGELVCKKDGFSPMENRYLATAPQLSWQEIKDGGFMDDLEDYMADHIPMRDRWIQAKNSLERLSGRNQIGNVSFANEDRLIQVQDVSFEQLEKNLQALAEWVNQQPESRSIDFLLAPNASWIYEDQLPDHTMTYDPQAARELIQQRLPERVRITDPNELLREHRDEAIYFKSDHHWTMRGAAYAYQQLAQAMELPVQDPFQYESQILGQEFRGSVYSQAPVYGYPGEDFEVLQSSGLKAVWEAEGKSGTILMEENFAKKDQYTAFMGGNYGVTRITNEAAVLDEPLLILKDSYANILLPFLAENYREIVMVDLRYYRENLAELMQTEHIEQVLWIYNMDFLCTDQNFVWLNLKK